MAEQIPDSSNTTSPKPGSAAGADPLDVLNLGVEAKHAVLLVTVLLRLRLQIGLDKHVDVAVEHALDVANFHLGALVLRQAVRLKNIGSNLAAESDTKLSVFDRLSLGLLLFPFQFVQSRSKNLHAHFLVLVLRAFVLALGYKSRGQMRDSHGRVRGVHMLSALAGRSICIDAKVLCIDDH